jgi:hypothetical protein
MPTYAEPSLDQVPGDGLPRRLTPDQQTDTLAELKGMVDEIRTSLNEDVYTRRRDNEDVRYCRWAGQSADGRKRKTALGKDPIPFDGASDNRVRLADKIIREQSLPMVAAATRVQPRLVGMDGTDASTAYRMGLVLDWIKTNQWGASWRRELKLLAN